MNTDAVKLLAGPYRQPRLKPGDKAHCHLRDAYPRPNCTASAPSPTVSLSAANYGRLPVNFAASTRRWPG